MRLLITIGWLIWGAVIYAQSGLVVTRIGMEDGVGLNSDNVFCTYQDARGFVWVGTVNGLQRFDGSKFLGYGTSKPLAGQLPISSLTEIFGGRGAELWLHFPLRNEVGVYNTATLTYRAVPIRAKGAIPVRHARKLKVDSHGNRYLCIWKYGILQCNATEDAFIDNNPFRLPPGWIPSIYFCEDTLAKRFWLPCPDSGLALHDVASGQTYTRQHNPIGHPILASKQLKQHPWEMFIDSKRRYWIFSWDTAHHKLCYNEQGQVLNDSAGLRELSGYQELRFFMETRSGGLWMYGVNCLYWYDKLKGRMEFLRGSGSGGGGNLRYGDVRHIMQDRDGSLWLSTDNGLYFTTEESGNRNVVNIKFANKESDHAINDLIQLKTGEYWLATWGTGIIALTDRLQRYEANIYRDMPPMHRFRQNAYKQLWALHQQPDGKVWIGCQAGAYMIHEPAAQRTAFLQCEAADGATLRYITADAKGHVWVGTQRGHLIQYDGQRFAVRQQLGTIVRKINFDEAGLMWVATEGNGLYCISADGQTILRHYTAGGQGLFQNMVYDIDVLDRHTIVCAAGALNMIDKRTGKVKWFTVEDGLPSNSVMRIRKDRAGYLWMVTQNGLCRYNPLNSRFTAYGSKDGVVMAQEATEADYLCNENYVMFAGGSALLFFKPEAFDQQVQPYDVTITDFKLQQRFLAVDSLLGLPGITLSANENSLSIYFTSLSYLQREKLTYFYQLEGLDKTWIKADRQGLVTYNLLPPGNYIFKIYAETIDGKRTAHVTTLPIRIRPPFWRTGWFLSTLLMLITLVAYMIHRLRINRILAVEAIRNRVARDLHDDMGSTLSTINILSAMAKAKLSSDVIKTNEYISKISDNSQRMMEAMDDIVWAIKPTNDSMHKVVARMREFATNVMEAKDIELDFKAEEAVSDVNIDMEARRDFFLVFKEAVNNAAKYARCTQVAIAVKTAQKKLYLTVQDNGVGFDVKQADSGNGLGNMQKRADALGGQLRIESMAGQGTVVTLMIPIN